MEQTVLRESDYRMMKRHAPRHTVNVEKSPILVANPSYATPAYDLITFCADERSFDEAVQLLKDNTYPKTFVAPADGFVSLMVDNDFLALNVYVDGEPYEGTLEDVQFDEAVPDDASFENRVAVTETGRAIARAYDPENLTADLLASRPAYAPVFRALIACCSAPDGATLPAMEAVVEAQPEAAVNAEGKKVYPQYFIDALETAGAIEWNGAWRATEAGHDQLAA